MAMKYFETTSPYYALIRAADVSTATDLYHEQVCKDLSEAKFHEVSRDYSIVRCAQSKKDDDNKSPTPEEVIELVDDVSTDEIMLIDGTLC